MSESDDGDEGVQVVVVENQSTTDKAKRIIPRERAVKIWTDELGNPSATFQWNPSDHENFVCGVCKDHPVIRCKAMTLRQHCKRNKHKDALRDMLGLPPAAAAAGAEEEEPTLVRQSAVFAHSGTRKKAVQNKKKKTKKRSPSPLVFSEGDDDEEIPSPLLPPSPPPQPARKRDREPKNKIAKKAPKKKKKQEEEEEEEEEHEHAVIAPVSKNLDADWQRYLAKHLGPKQREALFEKRLRKIMDEFENGAGGSGAKKK